MDETKGGEFGGLSEAERLGRAAEVLTELESRLAEVGVEVAALVVFAPGAPGSAVGGLGTVSRLPPVALIGALLTAASNALSLSNLVPAGSEAARAGNGAAEAFSVDPRFVHRGTGRAN